MISQSIHLPFFVYGTLLPGQPNYYLWREAIERVRPAVLPRSCLYDLGCYPMLVDAPDGEVRGLVVTIRPSSYRAAVALLDQLEGIGDSPIGHTRLQAGAAYCPAGEWAVGRGLGLRG